MYIYHIMLAAADPKEQKRMEIMRLKRRFLKDRKVTSAFYAKSQSRQKIQREVDIYTHTVLIIFSSVCVWIWWKFSM